MRTEQDIRQRHESELMLWAGFESKMTEAARACWERIRTIEWVLSDPTDVRTEPPDRATEPPAPAPEQHRGSNGSSDQVELVVVGSDDPEDEDE